MAASATTSPAGRTPEELAGDLVNPVTNAREYYMGDHLGSNLHLTLLAGGSYSLNLRGCQGLYGAAVGTWKLLGDRLLLEPQDQQGRLAEKPMRILHIRLLPGHRIPAAVVLIPDGDMDTFLREGVADSTCFRPVDLVTVD